MLYTFDAAVIRPASPGKHSSEFFGSNTSSSCIPYVRIYRGERERERDRERDREREQYAALRPTSSQMTNNANITVSPRTMTLCTAFWLVYHFT